MCGGGGGGNIRYSGICTSVGVCEKLTIGLSVGEGDNIKHLYPLCLCVGEGCEKLMLGLSDGQSFFTRRVKVSQHLT